MPTVAEAVQVDAIAHAIQLAVTPVFLLGRRRRQFLWVLANRLARIVDRDRCCMTGVTTINPKRMTSMSNWR